MGKLHATRFRELAYRQDGRALWRIVDVTDAARPAAVGPQYRTKAELMGDLEEYAREFGCEGAR